MPVITVKAGLEMLVFFCLKEIIVVSTLGEVVNVVVGAVSADLFSGGAEGVFIFANQFSVISLFRFQEFDGSVSLQELRLEFADVGSWR